MDWTLDEPSDGLCCGTLAEAVLLLATSVANCRSGTRLTQLSAMVMGRRASQRECDRAQLVGWVPGSDLCRHARPSFLSALGEYRLFMSGEGPLLTSGQVAKELGVSTRASAAGSLRADCGQPSCSRVSGTTGDGLRLSSSYAPCHPRMPASRCVELPN